MTKKSTDPAAEPLADPTSDRLVLAYVSVSARNAAAPARDLTAADVARLAYNEAARRTLADGTRPDPRCPDQELAAEIVGRLEATGLYSSNLEAVLAKRAVAEPVIPAAQTAPAEPATKTEG